MEPLIVRSHWGYSVDISADVWRLPRKIRLPMAHRKLYSEEWPKYGLDPQTPDEIQDYLLRTRCGNLEHYLAQMMHTRTAEHVERLFRIFRPVVCRPGPLLDVFSPYASLLVKLHSVMLGQPRGACLHGAFDRLGFAYVFEDGDFYMETEDGHGELREEQACDIVRTLPAIEACRIDPAAAVVALLVAERGYTCEELSALRVRDVECPWKAEKRSDWFIYKNYPPTIQGSRNFVRDLIDANRRFSYYDSKYKVNPESPLFQTAQSANGSFLPTVWFEDALNVLSSEIRAAGWVRDETPLGWAGFHQMHLAGHRDAWLTIRKNVGEAAAA